jgi:tRNA (mo5U34)-methyltransferase
LELDVLRERVNSRNWFHRIDLGQGIVTPGIDDSPRKLRHVDMPADLTGWNVIDVGAFDGFFSFEAERRGAARVLATDHFVWNLPGMPTRQGFDLAHEALGSRVESREIAVEDLSPDTVGVFDLVLFLGVLYHSQDPLRYLRNMRAICTRQLIVETHVDALDYPRPAMVFYPGATLNHDASNFWGPNPAAVVEMLKEVGFSRVDVRPCLWPGRLVVHAWTR